MNITQEHSYKLPPKELMAIFLNEEFFHTRYKMAGVTNYQIVHFGEKNGKFLIKIKRNVKIKPPEKLPSVVKKLIEDSNIITTLISWEPSQGDCHRGEFSFKVEGMPGEVHGTTIVKPSAVGSTYQLNLTIKTAIPIFGNRIAELVKQKVETVLLKDHGFTLEYIEKYHAKPQEGHKSPTLKIVR